MYDKRTAQSLGMQLASVCKGNAELEERVAVIQNELIEALNLKDKISSPELRRLNQVIYATRAFDSGLKTFLLSFDIQVPNNKRHINGYTKTLRDYEGDAFTPLKHEIRERIIDTIVEDRNRNAHVAGQYPTVADVDKVLSNVADYLSHVINLKN